MLIFLSLKSHSFFLDFLKISFDVTWPIYLFIFGYAVSLLLRRLFSSCNERGLLLAVVFGLLIAVASLVAQHGL